MSRRLIIRPEAEADIIEAAIWYEEREPALGLAFTSEIHAAIERAFRTPLFYFATTRKPARSSYPCKAIPLPGFLLVRADAIVVFAVLHAAQHERHWQRRMKELL